MINLNFLPHKYKKRAKKVIFFAIWKSFLAWITFILLLASNVFLWGGYFLEKELANWDSRILSISNKQPGIIKDIKKINANLDRLNDMQKDYVEWSKFLLDFSYLIPDGNKLDTLNVDYENKSFEILGFSRTRADLLELQKNLENSDIVYDVDYPLSNLLKSRDISFSFKGKIKIDNYQDF